MEWRTLWFPLRYAIINRSLGGLREVRGKQCKACEEKGGFVLFGSVMSLVVFVLYAHGNRKRDENLNGYLHTYQRRISPTRLVMRLNRPLSPCPGRPTYTTLHDPSRSFLDGRTVKGEMSSLLYRDAFLGLVTPSFLLQDRSQDVTLGNWPTPDTSLASHQPAPGRMWGEEVSADRGKTRWLTNLSSSV